MEPLQPFPMSRPAACGETGPGIPSPDTAPC